MIGKGISIPKVAQKTWNAEMQCTLHCQHCCPPDHNCEPAPLSEPCLNAEVVVRVAVGNDMPCCCRLNSLCSVPV